MRGRIYSLIDPADASISYNFAFSFSAAFCISVDWAAEIADRRSPHPKGSGSEDSCSRAWTKDAAKDGLVVFQACVHHQCRTRSEYSGCFSMYSCTEGQITSTLRLFSRANLSAFSANEDARPRPRNLWGTSVWINSSTFPVILYSSEATCPSR